MIQSIIHNPYKITDRKRDPVSVNEALYVDQDNLPPLPSACSYIEAANQIYVNS